MRQRLSAGAETVTSRKYAKPLSALDWAERITLHRVRWCLGLGRQ
jgi:hypothetical protein